MNDQNPFSTYSLDDQNSIADQLRSLKGSQKLNPDQTASVDHALSYLPQSKAAAESSMMNTMTLGLGTFQHNSGKSTGTDFASQMYVDPESSTFGGRVKDYTNADGSAHYIRPTPSTNGQNLVPVQNVPAARQQRAQLDASTPAGPRWLNPKAVSQTPGQSIAIPAMDEMSAIGEQGGRALGGILGDPYGNNPTGKAIGRATGGFAGGMAMDPRNVAMFALPESKLISGAFAAQGAMGTYHAVNELHDVWDRDDIPRDRKIELGTNMTLNALMTGLAGMHSVSGFLDHTNLPTADKAEIQRRIENSYTQTTDGRLTPKQSNFTPFDSLTSKGLPGTEGKPGESTTPLESLAQRSSISKTSQPGTAVPNQEINARKYPKGTALSPYVSRTPEGRIPVSPEQYRQAVAQGFGRTVIPMGPGAPKGEAIRVGEAETPTAPSRTNADHAEIPTNRNSEPSDLEHAMMVSGGQMQLDPPKATPKPFDEASAKVAVEAAGGQWKGIQKGLNDEPLLVMYNDPISNSTLATSIKDFSQEAVKARLDQHQSGQTPTFIDSSLKGKLDITETPTSTAQNPARPNTELSTAEKAALLKPDRNGVTDLRAIAPDVRHDWINKNSFFEIRGATDAADAARKARETFPENVQFNLNSYLDKDGVLHHGVSTRVENGEITRHPEPLDATEASRIDKAGQEVYASIQDQTSKFHERTGGKHVQVLSDLWDATKKALPPDTPIEGQQALYNKGLAALNDALVHGKGLTDFYKAFDVVKRRGEGGFLGGSRKRLSPGELDRLTNLHVDGQLSRWEKQGVPLSILTKPAFRSAVYGAKNPALELRYEELLKRGGEGTDPIGMLANVVSGVSNKMLSRDILSTQLSRAAFSREARLGQLDEYRKNWNTRDIGDTLLYYDATEKGDIKSLSDPTDQESANMLRTMLDQKRDQIQALGTGKLDKFIDNYMGRMWKFGPKEAIQQAMSSRPFAGGGSFLKPRSYEYFSDGIAAGLEPITYNPIDMQIMKLHEMDRYLAAHNWFNETKAYGLVREFEDKAAPRGWSRLDDNMFRAGEGKSWYAPADVASAVNNHLSPGLRSGATGMLYNPIANYNNLMNQANLGMSVFHGFETAYYSIAGGVGDVFKKLSTADISGLKADASRWADLKSGGPIAPLRQFMLGSKLLQESLHPGQFAELSDDIENLQRAGARARMPDEYRNNAREALRNAVQELRYKGFKVLGDSFSEQLMDNPGTRAMKVGTRVIGATLEQMARPIMEAWVPRIKIGAQAERARDYISRNAEASPEQQTRALRKIWDSMDDRFGEFTYDNMFMNRTLKDAVHLGVRSFGWNFGTARTFAGAAATDVFNLRDPESFAGQITNKNYSGISERQAFTLGLLTTTYVSARILSYFFNQEPDEYTKAGFAKTGGVNPDGSPTRIYVKSYLTDAYSFYHAPGQTTLNKAAPVWHQMGELYNNSDYWGNQIHPIHPTTSDALSDPGTYTALAKYAAQSAVPFSVTNYQQRRERGEGVMSSLTSGTAILPAPSWVGQTKAASLAYELFKTKLPRGPNEPDVAAKSQKYHQLATGYAAGTTTEKDIDKALDNHTITLKQYDGILAADSTGLKDGEMDTLNRHMKYLDPAEFIRVFDYATPSEQHALEDRFYQKWDKAVESDPDLAAEFEKREKLLRK